MRHSNATHSTHLLDLRLASRLVKMTEVKNNDYVSKKLSGIGDEWQLHRKNEYMVDGYDK